MINELSPDIKISKQNEVFYHFECNDEGIYGELYKYFSVKVPGSNFSPLVINKLWNGNVSFFKIKERLFPIGLFSFFQKFCEKYSYTYEFSFSDPTKETISNESLESFYKELFNGTKFYPRDYQQELIKTALEEKRGLLLSSTSSGKSIVLYVISRYLLRNKKRILIVVPNISLVTQLYKDFIDYGWEDTDKYTSRLFGGQTPDFKKPILISTFQSLIKKSDSFFEKYDAILVDEVQNQKCSSLQQISKKCISANFRIGLTGTLDKSELCDLYNIYGFLGPVLKTITTQELTEKGYLTKAFIRNIVINYPKEIIKKLSYKDYDTEKKAIYSFPDRNKVLKFIYSHIPPDQNSLILVNEIEHLNLVKEYLEKNFSDKYKLVIIHGKIKPELRESIRELMKIEKNIILLASFGTVSVGVNIPSIENVILLSSSKSLVRVIQSIGRGLRLLEGKSKVVIWDIVDSLRFRTREGNLKVNYLYKHWAGDESWEGKYKKGRMDYYKDQKFECKILEKKLGEL